MKRRLALTFSLLAFAIGVVSAAPARPLYLPSAPPVPPAPPRILLVVGTTWEGTLFTSNCRVTFNADATLTYTEMGRSTPGSWRQEGNRVTFDINKYSEYDAILNGNHLAGTGRNKAGMTCNPSLWRVMAEK
jgi:hypothetical protein